MTLKREYGRKYLFGPLGIGNVVWADDPQGRDHGWGDSHFYPRDVAKLGYLYLHGGEWNGKQIVPRDWGGDDDQTGEWWPRRCRAASASNGMCNEWGEWIAVWRDRAAAGRVLIVWPDPRHVIIVSNAGGNGG